VFLNPAHGPGLAAYGQLAAGTPVGSFFRVGAAAAGGSFFRVGAAARCWFNLEVRFSQTTRAGRWRCMQSLSRWSAGLNLGRFAPLVYRAGCSFSCSAC
jgi:hypothetical protein